MDNIIILKKRIWVIYKARKLFEGREVEGASMQIEMPAYREAMIMVMMMVVMMVMVMMAMVMMRLKGQVCR